MVAAIRRGRAGPGLSLPAAGAPGRASRSPRPVRRGPSRRRGGCRGSRGGGARRPRTSGRRLSGHRDRRRPARLPARPTRRRRRGGAGDPAASRTPGGATAAEPDAGNEPAGSNGNERTSVGPSPPRCAAVQLGQLGVIGEDEPDRCRRRSTRGVESRSHRPGQARESDHWIDAVADRHVDPPGRQVDRALRHAPVPVPVPRRDSSSTTLFCG